MRREKGAKTMTARGPKDASTMHGPRASICLLSYGNYLEYFRRCLESVLANTPLDQVELRLGFNDAAGSLHYALGLLSPAGKKPRHEELPGGIERFHWKACVEGPGKNAGEFQVWAWNSPVNLFKEPMARFLLHDVPLPGEYAVWLDDDSFVEPGWWEALAPLLDQKIDYIGEEWWVDYFAGQTDMIQAQPWYLGVPFALRDGKPGVHFMTGGFLGLRSERIRQANFPDLAAAWKGDRLRQYGGDTLLGEIARQLGWSRAGHHQHVKINVDLAGNHPAPRRGGVGRQFGAQQDRVVR
jgi:hypothetical protein